jgi:hypothetical protein
MKDTVQTRPTSASVHPPEINVEQPKDAQIAAPDEKELGTVAFRHAGWATWRNRVKAALANTAQPEARQNAFENCGSHAWLAANTADPTKFKITCDRCHDRFCLPCANERARRAARVIHEFTAKKELRFLTLTLRTEDEPLAESLHRLIACFRKLRNRPFWRRHAFGGAGFIEVKWNAESNRWHPHIHVLQEGRFMERSALAAEWYHCTGDSYVIDIRAIKDPARAAAYVAKYATKGYSSSIFHDKAKLEEAITALHGRRLMLVFGKWRGFAINDDENPEHWDPVTSLSNIRDLATRGSRWAQTLLQHLADPDSYATPGPMPTAEALQLGLPPPPPPLVYDNATHTTWTADAARSVGADLPAVDRRPTQPFAAFETSAFSADELKAASPCDYSSRFPLTAKAASMLPTAHPDYAPLPCP